jgi:ribose/xylose/arabinose/galactoside ABC-type transport system permease subunit
VLQQVVRGVIIVIAVLANIQAIKRNVLRNKG